MSRMLPCHVQGRARQCKTLQGCGRSWKPFLVSLRGVLQLVRTPACHTGGRSQRGDSRFPLIGGIIIKNHFAKNLPNIRRPSRPLSGAFRRGARPARFHFALPPWVQCTTARRWSVRPTGTETSGASVLARRLGFRHEYKLLALRNGFHVSLV